jgi:hypothetical protein
MLLFCMTYNAFAQRPKPHKGQRFIPPVFGHWKVGEVVVAEDDSLKPAFIADLTYDALTLLPPGMKVSFLPDYDPKAHESILVMTMWTPYPPEACNYGTTQYDCIGEGSNRQLDPKNQPFAREFSLTTYRDGIEFYKPLGANSRDIIYQIWVNGKGWIGHFFVAKDRQTMWTDVNPDNPMILEKDGTKRKPRVTPWVFQVYHRLPEGPHR